jgi:hypothetical protein
LLLLRALPPLRLAPLCIIFIDQREQFIFRRRRLGKSCGVTGHKLVKRHSARDQIRLLRHVLPHQVAIPARSRDNVFYLPQTLFISHRRPHLFGSLRGRSQVARDISPIHPLYKAEGALLLPLQGKSTVCVTIRKPISRISRIRAGESRAATRHRQYVGEPARGMGGSLIMVGAV